jgi:Heterokaryon incompatibility protein (HET)
MSLCDICSNITFLPKNLARPKRLLPSLVILTDQDDVDNPNDIDRSTFVAFLHSSHHELECRVLEGRASGNVCSFCQLLHIVVQGIEEERSEGDDAYNNVQPQWNSTTDDMEFEEDIWLLWKPARRGGKLCRDKDGLLDMAHHVSVGRQGHDRLYGMILLNDLPENKVIVEPSWQSQVNDWSCTSKTLLSDNTTGSIRALDLAKTWVDTCMASHTLCAQTETVKILPTRLLKLLVGDKGQVVQLVESSSLPQTKYITLSHRWGDVLPLMTCKANYKQHQEGIPAETLSKSFRDAVSVVHHMSYSYVWIDSLCIIQDSEIDKIKEIPKMADYYGNATFNIAAAEAENCHGGCFQARDGLSIRPLWVPFYILGRRKNELERTKSFALVSLDKRDKVSLLDSRGWVRLHTS